MALRSFLASAALWALGAAAASAQAPEAPAGPPANAEAVRAALLGFELSGEVLGLDRPWAECIDPAGNTLWRVDDFAVEGRLEIKDDGQACFRYRDTQFRRETCWAVRVEQTGRIRFDVVNDESLPLVALARRPVSSCGRGAPIA